MLKLMGAVLLMAAAVRCGLAAAGRLRERAETLDRLERSMRFLEEELSFSRKPLPKLLERLGNTQEGAVGRFYAGVAAALGRDPEGGVRTSWQRCVRTELSALRPEEREALVGLGEMLGRYDAPAQIKALRQTADRLSQFRAAARSDVPRLGKVYTALGVAGGLLAVLVLI